MNVTLTCTKEELDVIEKKAEELYPGKGVHHLITMRLMQKISKHKSEFPCDPKSKIEVRRIKKTYAVPKGLVADAKCVCGDKQMELSTYIRRYIITPLLD